ncbi:hypothetical protein NEMBOFW57_010692 [Staphylotrichum longicolle]|uniref:Heterokaryon incompatibility domain-containing protein n=1 Tax=Staphylotrichum longicolle TaxID=669026 RepID=A0AAD4ENI4_9PEZI|nr:hypothetical protein NEMBOFW57_010692 [Staphylotrichum longicolle]
MSTATTNESNAGLGPYQYQPLAKGSGDIRLIKIVQVQEARGNDTDVILEIDMFHVPSVKLALISQCPDLQRSRLVGPENTFRALFTIHHSTQKTKTELYQPGEQVMLWIDALCINQVDVAEKNTQVPRMGQIYRQAKGAVGYIGAPEPGRDPGDGFLALAWFGNAPVIKPPEGIPADQSDPRFQEWYRSYQIQQENEPPQDFAEALTSLFANDWFLRCWVIQEMVLSRETVCLYGYGQDARSWSLKTMAMLIERGQSAANHRHDLNKAVKGSKARILELEKAVQVDSWRVLREDLAKKPSGLGIVELLSRTRFGKATDLRDKVYALLGLMNEEDVPVIRVDYSESYTAAQLFRDVAVHCMASLDGPATLVHAGLESSIRGLPTWVPDWSTMYRTPLNTGIYNACANLFRPINVLPGRRKLSALGVKVDIIAHTGIPMTYPDAQLEKHRMNRSTRDGTPDIFGLVLSAAILCERLRERHPAGYPLKHENWPDVVWRTCCVDRNWAGKRVTGNDRLSFHACLKRFGFGEDLFAAVKLDEATGQMPVQSASRSFQDSGLNEAALSFELMVIEFQKGRVLGTTAGGLFGSFPSTTKVGDIVVVLFGGWVPFVLRPVEEDLFELVGAAYVHGIMDGEWVQAAVAADEPDLLRDFVIQ